MKGATKAMVAMNKQMTPTEQAKVIKDFQKQSAQIDMAIEMMSDAIDETLDKYEAEEETEDLINQVLDEIGVGVASKKKVLLPQVLAVMEEQCLLDKEIVEIRDKEIVEIPIMKLQEEETTNAHVVVSHDKEQGAIGIGAGGGDPCFIII